MSSFPAVPAAMQVSQFATFGFVDPIVHMQRGDDYVRVRFARQIGDIACVTGLAPDDVSSGHHFFLKKGEGQEKESLPRNVEKELMKPPEIIKLTPGKRVLFL